MHDGRRIPTILTALHLSLAGAVALPAVGLPDLTGFWRLNRAMSDDPATVMKGSRDSGDPAGDGSMGRGRGRGHGMGRGGSAHSRDEGAVDRDFFAALQTLRIRHAEPALTITDDFGRECIFYTDGRKAEDEQSYGGTTKVTARWKDGRIEVTSVPQKGRKIVQTYAITADRAQLTVTTQFEGGRRSDVTIRRVYDAVPEGAPSPPAPQAPPADETDSSISSARSH